MLNDMSMKSSELHKLWDAPDNSRLTSKQLSFRLPVHVAAKLAALCELYPRKSRTEIVGDLLAAALNDLEEGLPIREVQLEEWERDPSDPSMTHTIVGPRVQFKHYANKHYQELERELGNEKPGLIYEGYEPR